RTVCANDQAYRLWPISRRYLPSWSNSRSCAALAAYAGPVVLPREKTKMCPLEFTATPETSPRYMFSGSFSKLGTESKGISGAPSWAKIASGAIIKIASASAKRFMVTSSCLSLVDPVFSLTSVFSEDSVFSRFLQSERLLTPRSQRVQRIGHKPASTFPEFLRNDA